MSILKIIPLIIVFCLGWYCSNKWYHRNDEHKHNVTVISENVLSVDSGNKITVSAGLFNRRSRSVSLWGIQVPSKVADSSTTSLRNMINKGDNVNIEIKNGERIGVADIVGIVTHNGLNCNLEQLRKGWGKATVEDKEFINAQNEAEKAHCGIWQKNSDNRPHRPHWWSERED